MDQIQYLCNQVMPEFTGREVAKKEKRKYEGPDLEQEKAQLSFLMREHNLLFMGPFVTGHRNSYVVNHKTQKQQDPKAADFLMHVIKSWGDFYNCVVPDGVIKEFPRFFHQRLDDITDQRYDVTYNIRHTYKKPIVPI